MNSLVRLGIILSFIFAICIGAQMVMPNDIENPWVGALVNVSVLIIVGMIWFVLVIIYRKKARRTGTLQK